MKTILFISAVALTLSAISQSAFSAQECRSSSYVAKPGADMPTLVGTYDQWFQYKDLGTTVTMLLYYSEIAGTHAGYIQKLIDDLRHPAQPLANAIRISWKKSECTVNPYVSRDAFTHHDTYTCDYGNLATSTIEYLQITDLDKINSSIDDATITSLTTQPVSANFNSHVNVELIASRSGTLYEYYKGFFLKFYFNLNFPGVTHAVDGEMSDLYCF